MERAAQAAKPQLLTPAERHAAMRQAIAAAMARAKREIPHYYLGTTIDMSRALVWLQAENERRPVTERLLHAVLLIKAVALAVCQAPQLNGFWIDREFRPSQDVHVGMGILSADHRASDGHRGSLFLTAVDRLLQEPEKL